MSYLKPKGLLNNSFVEIKGVNFNLHFLKKSIKILKIIFSSCWSQSSLLLIFLLVVGLLKEFIVYQVGLVASKYYAALPSKDISLFINTTIFAVLVIISIAVTLSLTNFLADLFAISCRSNLNKYLHNLYLLDTVFYKLNTSKEFDNIDQRFTQDVLKITSQLSSIILTIIVTPFLVAFYTYKTAEMSGWLGPVSAFLFFVVFSIINKLILGWVSKAVFELERKEGNFRFKHVQIRCNSESIAFLNCVNLERTKTDEILEETLAAQYNVALRKWLLNFITTCSDYFGSILTYLAIGFAIFGGMYSDKSGTEISVIISQTSFFLMYLINKFTQFIDMANNASEIIGITYRVSNVLDELENQQRSSRKRLHSFVNRAVDKNAIALSSTEERVDNLVQIRNMSARFPFSHNTIFIQNLQLNVHQNQTILITGPSGCGKSSILRCLAELWPVYRGEVDWHLSLRPVTSNTVMFLPQVPYFTTGCLLEQVLLPQSISDPSLNLNDATMGRIKHILHQLDLDLLIDRFGLENSYLNDWVNILSPGEQQRISFARLLFHAPPLTFLDEATSQINEEMQTKMYELLQRYGITFVSVAHRHSLIPFHSVRLNFLGENGAWELSSDGVESSLSNDRL